MSNQYKKTGIKDNYLDLYNPMVLKHNTDDREYIIEAKYHHRPDKLAKDLYGSEQYWYVFILRNMDVLEDPIFDFKTGVTIRIPTNNNVKGIT